MIFDKMSSRWSVATFFLASSSILLRSCSTAFVVTPNSHNNFGSLSSLKAKSNDALPEEVDVVVIGSGLAGLSCAALLSHCEKDTLVLESHDTVGGAAHGWERRGFHFESGPSLYSGFSMDESPNPLKNVFQIIEEEPEWIT
mmetsp:Transcript_10999/g.17017  ORF Transcript_10999/g.17017 Transcript_10999/m.17017 type:complete len:142 (+) Transcript_10999:579-1004(+)